MRKAATFVATAGVAKHPAALVDIVEKTAIAVSATVDRARQVLDFSGNSEAGQITNGKRQSNVQNVTAGISNMQGMLSNIQLVKEHVTGLEQQAKET